MRQLRGQVRQFAGVKGRLRIARQRLIGPQPDPAPGGRVTRMHHEVHIAAVGAHRRDALICHGQALTAEKVPGGGDEDGGPDQDRRQQDQFALEAHAAQASDLLRYSSIFSRKPMVVSHF